MHTALRGQRHPGTPRGRNTHSNVTRAAIPRLVNTTSNRACPIAPAIVYAIETWTALPPKHKTLVYHREIPEDVPHRRATVLFHSHLPKSHGRWPKKVQLGADPEYPQGIEKKYFRYSQYLSLSPKLPPQKGSVNIRVPFIYYFAVRKIKTRIVHQIPSNSFATKFPVLIDRA